MKDTKDKLKACKFLVELCFVMLDGANEIFEMPNLIGERESIEPMKALVKLNKQLRKAMEKECLL